MKSPRNRRYSIFATVAALLATLAFASSASALMVQCDNCNDFQMQQHLRNLGGLGLDAQGATHIHVADFAGNVLRAYEVQCNRWGWPNGGEPGEGDKRTNPSLRFWGGFCEHMTISPAAVQPDASEQYGVLLAFYLDTGGTWSKQLSAPVWAEWQLGGPYSGQLQGFTAFDVAGNLNGRVLVGGALTNHCTLCGIPQLGLLANALATTLLSSPAGVIVTVRFHEGSTARYVFRFNEHWEFTYIQGSARSDSDQWIPDIEALASPGSSTWYFSEGAGGSFFDYFESVRPGFVRPVPSGGGSGGYRLECSWDGVNLSCVVR
jgi:hypothetical protein